MAYLRMSGVSVDIPIYDARTRSMKLRVFGAVTQRLPNARLERDSSGVVTVKALQSIDLSLEDGDRVGLIGRNGAGKTTLLKVMSGIYEPTAGSIDIRGRVVSLLDLVLGMDDDAPGHQNILLRGMMLGATRREVEQAHPDIEAFCELGDYLDLPVRTYSSGMKLRLAFAVSTAFQPDILLMDEVIGVGDSAFVHKANARLHSFGQSARILVLSSHSPALIREFCDKAAWLDEGRLVAFGPADAVLNAYEERAAGAVG